MRCLICNVYSKGPLCKNHLKDYTFDKSINGLRLKKRGRGSRYIQKRFHKTETRLARIVESIFGKSNVFVSYYPMWAKSKRGVLYEYDILVKNKNLLIAYNGEQHYKYVKFFHKSIRESFRQRIRDKVKRQIASTNGYSLIEFKYTEPIVKPYVIGRLSDFT